MGKRYICCHKCDEISEIPYPSRKGRYKCPNCGHTLFRNYPGMIEKLYAMSIASFILFILANYYPILTFSVIGKESSANFATSIEYLYLDGDYIMAIAVFMTTILVPFVYITLSMVLFGLLYHGKRALFMIPLIKILEEIRPWGMLDVFMVGTLVSIVKLVKMGDIHTGISFWAFVILIPILAYSHMIFDPHPVWDMIEESDGKKRR